MAAFRVEPAHSPDSAQAIAMYTLDSDGRATAAAPTKRGRQGAPAHHAIDIDIGDCLVKIISHFEHSHTNETDAHSGASEQEEQAINLFLRVLCGVLSPDMRSHAHGHHDHTIEQTAYRLNGWNLPDMVLFLLCGYHHTTVEMAARLGVLLLQSTRMAYEVRPKERVTTLCSQIAFLRAFRRPVGRRAVQALFNRLKHHQAHLVKREHEDALHKLQRNQNEEDQESALLLELLRLLEYLTAGHFEEMQVLLRQQEGQRVDIVALVAELVHSFGRIFKPKLLHGFEVQEVDREAAILEIEKDLRREANDAESINQLFRTLNKFVSGPNRSNQDLLIEHKCHEPMTIFLTYMEDQSQRENSDTHVHTLELLRDEAIECIKDWCLTYRVESHEHHGHTEWHQKGATEIHLSNAQLHAVAACDKLLKGLDIVDEDCENNIVTLIMSLLEGREDNDHAFDIVAQTFFPFDTSEDIIFHNLNHHFRQQPEEESEEADEGDERHFSASEVAYRYYILAKLMADHSAHHGKRISSKLVAWEKEQSHDVKDDVGSVEVGWRISG